MKIAKIDREFLHVFWTTKRNSLKFSKKICFKIILRATKNQVFTLSLEDTFFEKSKGGDRVGYVRVKVTIPESLMCIFG